MGDEREADLALEDKLSCVNDHLPGGERTLHVADVECVIEVAQRHDGPAGVHLDRRMHGVRVQIEELTTRAQRGVHAVQGVHGAFGRDASQGRGEHHHVKRLGGRIDARDVHYLEGDRVTPVVWQGSQPGARLLDRGRVGIEGQHRTCAVGVAPGQAPVPAAHLQDIGTGELDELVDRLYLGLLRIASHRHSVVSLPLR
jgi:hypothetical protein